MAKIRWAKSICNLQNEIGQTKVRVRIDGPNCLGPMFDWARVRCSLFKYMNHEDGRYYMHAHKELIIIRTLDLSFTFVGNKAVERSVNFVMLYSLFNGNWKLIVDATR